MKGMDEVRRICEARIAKLGPGKPPSCSCGDHGLRYRCTVVRGVTYWGACRCACLIAGDWGVVGKSEGGAWEFGIRPFGRDIPHEDDVRDRTGRKLTRDDLYTLEERHRAEAQLTAAHSPEAVDERAAIQAEYEFPL